MLKKTISSTINYAILCSIVLTAVTAAPVSRDFPEWIRPIAIGIVLLFFLASILNYFYQRWYFAVYFYDLTSDLIRIKKGPITPREINIPYERIQDVYVDQDLLDRIFGLYDVHLSSATAASGMEAHIDGVERQAGQGLREELLRMVKERISKNRNAPPPSITT